jgi:hypothetical protein
MVENWSRQRGEILLDNWAVPWLELANRLAEILKKGGD